MNKSQTLLRLHELTAAYVRRQFRALGTADAHDLASAAYCLARQRLASCPRGRGHAQRLAQLAKMSVLDVFRRRQTGQGIFERSFLPLDTPDSCDAGRVANVSGAPRAGMLGDAEGGGALAADRHASYSDHGVGVERMTRQIDGEDVRLPNWVYGVRIERAKLRSVERRIANGLASGKSTHTMRRDLSLNGVEFWAKMKNLKSRFAPYYKGLCDWRERKPLSPL